MQYSNMLPDKFHNVVNQIKTAIDKSSKILVAAHLRPDGDATGSVSGFVKSLQEYGKNVDIAFHDEVNERFQLVMPEGKIIRGPEIKTDHDLIFILDSGDLDRTGLKFTAPKDKFTLINIDHHASNNNFGDINFVDTKSAATCEMITALISFTGLPLTADVAKSLILGLFTDTRFFQNEGLRHTTHLAAATLYGSGLDSSVILRALNNSRKELDVRVQGYGLSNFELDAGGRLAKLILTKEKIASLGANFDNLYASGIFNCLTSVEGIIASVVIFEREDGVVFCEFRSMDSSRTGESAPLFSIS